MKEIIQNSKKIAIKIGSSTITSEDGTIDRAFIESLAHQVKDLMDQGKELS